MFPRLSKPSVDNGEYWEVKLGHHQWGEFSMAAIESKDVVDGHSQIESGSMRLHPSGHNGTFVGLYDGHDGPDASVFIKDHLFEIVKSKFALELASVLSLAECDFLVPLVVQTDICAYMFCGNSKRWFDSCENTISVFFQWFPST